MTAPTVAKTPKLYIQGAFCRSESDRVYPVGRVNVPRASRKDVRDAVRAARSALPGWSSRTAYNRGQVLYRVAEMLEARRREFVRVGGGGRAAGREVDACVDVLVYYAGCADKLSQLGGSVNQVAGPYFTFTVPEPVGVVALVAPERPPLLPLLTHMAAALCGGNTVVALVAETAPLAGLLAAELLATGDVPAGAAAVLSGLRSELLAPLGSHRDVDALDPVGCTPEQRAELERRAADGVTRVLPSPSTPVPGHHLALASLELKTIWHPVGV
ncbi:MAG TPA: aldehyde dehydrogenase family protein [Verrucomicrobiae bacterium]|nr:aldehyde dehydrogenase family protein [Verrucomicrobiae bacterium]